MAMEKLAVVRETHNKAITALCYNPMKHEIVVGCEGILGFIVSRGDTFITNPSRGKYLMAALLVARYISGKTLAGCGKLHLQQARALSHRDPG